MPRRNPHRAKRPPPGSTREAPTHIDEDAEDAPELPAFIPQQELAVGRIIRNVIVDDPPAVEEHGEVARVLTPPPPPAVVHQPQPAIDNPDHHQPAPAPVIEHQPILLDDDAGNAPELAALVPHQELALDRMLRNVMLDAPHVVEEPRELAPVPPPPSPQAVPHRQHAINNPELRSPAPAPAIAHQPILIADDAGYAPELPALVPHQELGLGRMLRNVMLDNPHVAEEPRELAPVLPPPPPQAVPHRQHAINNPDHHSPAPAPGIELHDNTPVDRPVLPEPQPALDRAVGGQQRPSPNPEVPEVIPGPELPNRQHPPYRDVPAFQRPIHPPFIDRLTRPTLATARRGFEIPKRPLEQTGIPADHVSRLHHPHNYNRRPSPPPPVRARKPPIPIQRLRVRRGESSVARAPPPPVRPVTPLARAPALPPPVPPVTPPARAPALPPPVPVVAAVPASPVAIDAGCVICLERVSTIVLQPCNHLILCSVRPS